MPKSVYKHPKWGPYGVIPIPKYPGQRRPQAIVHFQRTGRGYQTSMTEAKSGRVRDWSAPSVYGFGVSFRGAVSMHGREYKLWQAMLSRCYNPKSLCRDPSYKGVTVCERWRYFRNFLADLPRLPGYGRWKSGESVQLDKDIRDDGSRQYGPGSCSFASPLENCAAKAPHGIPVRSLETGEVFRNSRIASEHSTDPAHVIRKHCTRPPKTIPARWEYV